MNKFNIILSSLILAGLCACENPENDTLTQAQFVGSIVDMNMNTRASGTSWANGDQIGITSSDGQLNNSCFATKGDGGFSSSSEFWFKNNNTVNFTAYYPYSSNTTIIKTITENDENNSSIIDYLYATTSSITSSSPIVPLRFSHKMCKIVLSFASGTGNPTLTTGTTNLANFIGVGTFNGKTGVAQGTGTETLSLSTNLSQKISVIMFPGTSSISIAISANGQVYRGSIPNSDWVGGKEYTFNISLSQDGIMFNSNTITDWNNQTATNVIVQK